MQEVEFPDDEVSEMPASSVMITSPQFNSVMEQMSDFGEKVHYRMEKKATTTHKWKSMPLIEVTCFDDEAYNKKIQNELENAPATETNEATTANEESIIGHSAAQQSNERDENSGDSRINEDTRESIKATLCLERNSWVENNTDGAQSKKVNTPRKCLKGFVVKSPQISNRSTSQTKTEVRDTETKRHATGPEELKNSGPPKSSRKPDSRQAEALASRSSPRRRNTVCSFSSDIGSSNEPENNSELNNKKASVPRVIAAQNAPRSPKMGERKLSSEILNGRKKPERIDLSFKMDSLANDSRQSKEFRKRSRTYEGKTQNPRQATSALKRSSSEEHYIPDGDFRVQHDNRRLADGNPSTCVGKPRGTFQMQESNESLGISESNLSLLKNAAVVSSTDNHSFSTRRVSTSILRGVISTSKGVSEKQPLSQVDVTQRLNLSPPRRRRVGTPKPPQDDKKSHLGVTTSPTRIKSETDLHKLVSEEEADKQKKVCLTTPPHVPRGSDTKSGEKKSFLGVSSKISLSKSETDLRKLLSDEELADARRPSLASPQRPHKLSSSKALTTTEALHLASSTASSPVSPQLERKIYLAAAKPPARLPIRAKVRNDLAASSQIIIDQAEKEFDQCSERLPHISVEEVMKSWHTDSRHWNVVSSLVKQSLDCTSKTNMEAVKNCRYIRDGVLKKKNHSH